MGGEGQWFRLPDLPGRAWCLALATARPAPGDLVPPQEQIPLNQDGLSVEAHSLVVLEGR
jgi:hypothetical protein